jgi:hypothetical protein
MLTHNKIKEFLFAPVSSNLFEALRSARVLTSYRDLLVLIQNYITDTAYISNLPIYRFVIFSDAVPDK